MMTISERIAQDGIAADVKLSARPAPDDFPLGSYSWDVTLTFQGRTLKVPFHTGPAVTGEPTTEDVLDCVISDAAGIVNASDILDWASEYGYELGDYEQRARARRIYDACVAQTEQLRTFLAERFDAYLWDTERL